MLNNKNNIKYIKEGGNTSAFEDDTVWSTDIFVERNKLMQILNISKTKNNLKIIDDFVGVISFNLLLIIAKPGSRWMINTLQITIVKIPYPSGTWFGLEIIEKGIVKNDKKLNNIAIK